MLENAVPGYWMYETSGVLRPAVIAYLNQEQLSQEHIAALRAYFRQWAAAPAWRGPEVERLRQSVDFLHTRRAIRAWIDQADALGMDPL